MNLKAIARRTEVLLAQYENFLVKVTEADFQRHPLPGEWSYSEVYSHIFTANQACFMAIDNCIKGKAEATDEKAKLSGRVILFLGLFPPVKIKAPKRIAELVQKIDKDEAKREIQLLRDMLSKAALGVANAAPNQKALHPRMGYFNARQWLRFIEIHTRHHLKQLHRIESQLQTS